MMRGTSIRSMSLISACVLLGLLANLAGVASATPAVTLEAAAVPIPVNPSDPHSPTYPGTGAILGAPAAMEAVWKISGTEYGGSPSPLTWIKIYTPAGVTLHPRGFATCTEVTLEAMGPGGCPRRSFAGPIGEATGIVTFGVTRVYEKAAVNVFFDSEGGLIFYALGATPAWFQIFSTGRIFNASPPFGQLFSGGVPLVESVPGALDASIEQLKITIGAAFMKDKQLISYATMPRTCPAAGYYIVKTELSFLSGATVSALARATCTKHKKK